MTSISDRCLIFDTTLRDGEQAPGCSMSRDEKVRAAQALSELRVDIIEAGFPAASAGDFESVRAVASEVDGPIICALARCCRSDVQTAAKALRPAARHRIHVFIATSPIHREFKLKMSSRDVLQLAIDGVRTAREYCGDVEFSAEDASRTEREFLLEVVESVVEAGATTINLPDTVGYMVPDEFAELFRFVKSHARGVESVCLSAHCHNDLGMAVANSLAAVASGARQIECTINGIGERAGNCSLEEIVMALKVRAPFFNVGTGVKTSRLYPTSRLISKITGMPIPRNKAVVRQNSFAHEAGIHQHGMLNNPATYEIMKPDDVGVPRSQLVLGKHSGRHAFRERVQALGFELDDLEFDRTFDEFKRLSDKKKLLFDGDIEALILRAEGSTGGPWKLVTLRIIVDSGNPSQAVVRLEHSDGSFVERKGEGDGPLDAAFKTIEDATGVKVLIHKFDLRSVTEGGDAQGEAVVCAEYNSRTYRGSNVSTDVLHSSVCAFLEVINRVESSRACRSLS